MFDRIRVFYSGMTLSSPRSHKSSLDHPSLLAPFVPDQAARVVVTWLNKAREAEEKRARAAAEPLALDGGGSNDEISEEDDDDQDEFVYDMQVCKSSSSWCCLRSEYHLNFYNAVLPLSVLDKQKDGPSGITGGCGATVAFFTEGMPCRT